MNPREFTERWGQYTSGLELTEEETLAMEQLLDSDAALRTEVTDDHQLHLMLEAMGTIHESQDEFVGGVLAACTGVDNPFAPLLDREPVAQGPKYNRLLAGVCLGTLALGITFAFVMYSQRSHARAQAELAMQIASEAMDKAEQATKLSEERTATENPPLVDSTVAEEPTKDADAPSATAPAVRPEPVAVISGDSPPGVWRGDVEDRELVAGEFELASGQSILRMAGGSVLSIRAPARFALHHSAHVTLHEGEIEVQVAPEDVGFRVTTANSRVIDLGTKFRVTVSDEGRTRVTLDVGEVVVIPWESGSSSARFHLQVGEYEEAVVHGPPDGVDGLHASYTAGPAGFKGSVRLEDSAFELTSLERFQCVFDGIAASFRSNPEKAKADWLRARTVLARVTGSVTVEDDEVAVSDLDSLLQIEERFANDAAESAARISGAFSVAGRQHRFRSRAEYDRIRAGVLESLSALGIRPYGEMQRDHDLKTNPFRP